MANTVIQIKRSTATGTPPNGSLTAGEQAYSYSSNTLFIGTPDGTGIIPVGGKSYLDTITSAFSQANNAYATANASSSTAVSYEQANTARNHANAAFGQANTATTNAGKAFDQANTATTNAGNAYTQANAASSIANTKLSLSGGTITGNLAITGSLTVSGNAFSIDTQTLKVSDPLIYLAGNNYVSDIVDIGFVGNYVNVSGSNVHTGIFRDATTKEYYVFEGYNQEPEPNHIDIAGNNFTISVLNATLRTSNIILAGVNAISWLNNIYNQANTATTNAGKAYDQANTATTNAGKAYDQANTATTNAGNAYTQANTGTTNAGIAFNQANTAYAAANAASAQAANADFLTSGTVGSSRISGSYTGITGVGTITAGTWNGNTIKVPYGGTGLVSFTTNGILYGNNTGDLKVTSAGTEGQVLQASSSGVPQFAMLDGGTF